MLLRLSKLEIWNQNLHDWRLEGNGDEFKSIRGKHITDQIRATGGDALIGMEKHEKEMEYRQMFWNEKIRERDERRAAKKAEEEKAAFEKTMAGSPSS